MGICLNINERERGLEDIGIGNVKTIVNLVNE